MTSLAFASIVSGAFVARVEEASDRGVVIASPEIGRRLARIAVFGDYRAQKGDQVLACTDAGGGAYVFGVLSSLREAPRSSVERFTMETAEDGATVLRVAHGDLRIEAAEGRVSIEGASGVDVESDGAVRVASRERVDVRSEDREGRTRAGLAIEGDAAEISAGLFATRAARLYTLAEEATVVASRLDLKLEELRQRADRIDTEAGRIVESAKETYRKVEDLAQTEAGRIRLVAKSTLHALAERAKLKAKSIFAIDGERIYLG